MKKTRYLSIFLICVLLLQCLIVPIFADELEPVDEGPQPPDPDFHLDCKSVILIDLNSGRSVYEQDADERIYPASLTKIMTCLLALEKGNLSDVLTFNENLLNGLDEDSSSAGLIPGEQMTLENVLYCMMVQSANEACNAVADYISGNSADFIRLMNERAYELGCKDTHFANANGLHDERHYSTARDLAIITQAALKSETFKKITNTAQYVVPATNLAAERPLKTTNQLILKSSSNPYYYSRAAGVKTGYTGAAGRCIITTASGNGMNFLAVICGAKTTILPDGGLIMENFPCAMELLDYAFDGYSEVTALSTLYPVAQVTVSNSAGAEAVALSPSRDIKLLMPNCYNEDDLKTVIKLDNQTAEAPIHAGDKLGVVNITYQGTVLETADLIAIADVARSELSGGGSATSAYIQQNWWKWIVILIVIAIAAMIGLFILSRIRLAQARRRRLQDRRRALNERMRRYHDEY